MVSVHEAPGSGTPDEDVLDYARDQERAVATENVQDYRPLAEALIAAGESHSGLVLTTEKRWPRNNPGALIAALDQLLKAAPEQAGRRRALAVSSGSGRARADPGGRRRWSTA